MKFAKEFIDQYFDPNDLCDGIIVLDLKGHRIGVKTNSETLLEKLGIYFAHTLGSGDCDQMIYAIDREALNLALPFVDWKRETGKSGRKDAYYDLEDGRIVLKVRTGMIFLQSQSMTCCVGPCLDNDNQVINFINAQYMNHLQRQEAVICHASGVVKENKALGIAGFSGGGKSTLMLHILNDQSASFMTNDRLFIQDKEAIGIPKLPRVNPGTILNNDSLSDLIDEDYAKELNALPLDELWEREEKYDVFIDETFGDDKIIHNAPLHGFLILNWDRNSADPCQIEKIDLSSNTNLLKAIMKSPGPFYQMKEGFMYQDKTKLDPDVYLDALKDTPIYVASGQIDFDFAKEYCLKTILNE